MKNFSIFKVKEPSSDPKKPTHTISAKVGDSYVYIGKCWTKDSNGNKFLSCNLDKPYKSLKGYSVCEDKPESVEILPTDEEIPF